MADKFEFKVHDAQLQAFFAYAGYKARDLREPFRKIAFEVLLPGIAEQFATEGERSGEFWEDLSTPYDLYKELRWGPKPILEASGAGKAALLNPGAFEIHAHSMRYSPDAPEYMDYHQTGTSKMPARPWLRITPDDELQMTDIFEDWLDDLRSANQRRGPVTGYSGPIPQGFTLI